VRFKLTGARATDVADASGTLLFDVVNRRWSAEMLEASICERRFCRRCSSRRRLRGACQGRAQRPADCEKARRWWPVVEIKRLARWEWELSSRGMSARRLELRCGCVRVDEPSVVEAEKEEFIHFATDSGSLARYGCDARRGGLSLRWVSRSVRAAALPTMR